MAAAATLTLAACTSSVTSSTSGSSSSTPATTGTVTSSAGAATSLQQQYESVIHAVLPSIVEITTNVGLGSGIVFDNKGDIVTNDHVVGSAKSFTVRLTNSAKSLHGTLVGTFAANDLAVIKVSGASDLHPATFADSSKVEVGQIVLAMGNPLGLSSSVTNGIVSAVGRTLTEPNTQNSPGATLPDSIQTSAAINPGNSGGALVDLNGKVVGIPTLAATDQQQGGAAPGIGFAIPSNTVTSIAKQLIDTGHVTNSGRAALGIEAQTVTDASGNPAGVGVASAVPGKGAAKAGLESGDIITKVAGHAVQSVQQLSAILAHEPVGKTISVTYLRNGTSHTVQVKLGQLTS